MKRVPCPKCQHLNAFDETRYTAGQTLVFVCEECKKQFSIRIGTGKLRSKPQEEDWAEVEKAAVGSDGWGEVTVYRSFRHTNLDHYTPFFSHRDTVTFKLAQMPRDGFIFWSDYENEVINGKNPIFPSTANLQGNIDGGFGVWCGYGQTSYTVSIPDSI